MNINTFIEVCKENRVFDSDEQFLRTMNAALRYEAFASYEGENLKDRRSDPAKKVVFFLIFFFNEDEVYNYYSCSVDYTSYFEEERRIFNATFGKTAGSRDPEDRYQQVLTEKAPQ